MNASRNEMTIHFWGVRGSTPTPDVNKRKTGGNTPCIALRYRSEAPIIIDAGTGIRLLGSELCEPDGSLEKASILFSHFHWDHIQGLPFLPALYSQASQIDLLSTRRPEELEHALGGQMQEPYFPFPYSALRAHIRYRQIGGELQLGSVTVRPITLNHPGGSSGFRFDSPAGSVLYISDHEHGDPAIDNGIVTAARDADILIYDAHFTPEEYPNFVGWGHSTWLEATRLGQAAGVKSLCLFHHSPYRNDEGVSEIVRVAKEKFLNTEAAREGRPINLPL